MMEQRTRKMADWDSVLDELEDLDKCSNEFDFVNV